MGLLGKGIIVSFIALVADIYLSVAGIYPLNLLGAVAAWANGIPLIGPVIIFPVLNFIIIWIIVAIAIALVTRG